LPKAESVVAELGLHLSGIKVNYRADDLAT